MWKKVKPIKNKHKSYPLSVNLASGVQNYAVNKSDQKLNDILD